MNADDLRAVDEAVEHLALLEVGRESGRSFQAAPAAWAATLLARLPVEAHATT